jgi:hypothetical protein
VKARIAVGVVDVEESLLEVRGVQRRREAWRAAAAERVDLAALLGGGEQAAGRQEVGGKVPRARLRPERPDGRADQRAGERGAP